MPKIMKLAAIAAAGMLVAASAYSQDKVVAKVNGVEVPQSRVDMQVREAISQGAQDSGELRKAALDNVINFEILTQEAGKKGLDKKPEIAEQMALARQQILVQAYVRDYVMNHPPSEEALKAEYDKKKNDPGMIEYKTAHILVKTEKEAKAIEAQLKKGGNFAEIAKQKTQDPGSRDTGGELDWVSPANFVTEYSQAMVAMKKGQLSHPVKSPYGYHIIKLIDTRPMPFENAKPMLMRPLQQQAIQNMVKELRSNAKVEITQ